MEQMTHPELASAVRQYFRRNGNKPMSSAEVHADQFMDQDKVRFQLVFSNMALKPPHEMIKLQEGGGTKGVKWRLRTPDDPPFVEPVKVPRAKRTIEIDRPLASAATGHVSKVSHRSIGNVAETPPEVRAREVADSLPVEHRALTPPPPNNALASALARAAKNFVPPKSNVPVAAFKDQKDLKYELAPDAKLTSIPRGASGLNPIHGAVEIPRHRVEAKANAEASITTAQPKQEAKGVIKHAAEVLETTRRAFGPQLKLVEPEQAVGLPTVGMELPSSTVPNGTPQSPQTVPQTPGQILDLLLTTIGPMFKSMITDAVKEALNAHAQVSPSHPPLAPRYEVGPSSDEVPAVQIEEAVSDPAISVPPLDPPKPTVPKHKPVMPQDAAAMVKTRLPKVTVIGLPKPQWEFDVKERFAKWLDIRTVHADARGKTARDWCKGSDHVILMVDYNSHSLEAALKAQPTIQYERLPGGPGKLDDRLRDIIQSYAKVANA